MASTEEEKAHDMRKVAFDQNHASFRSLNQQMWQIPLISMTLTGGLWFGVSRVENFPVFQLSLLLLAALGNVALFIVILRLRFVMEQHLVWLKANYPEGFVSAVGKEWYNKPFVVRTSFQGMLLLAAILSSVLFMITARQTNWNEVLASASQDPVVAWYEDHATNLADGYEALSFEQAHPALVALVESRFSGRTLRVLDVGAGTGRDAAWFAQHGHNVTAVEPSPAMRRIAQNLHADAPVNWRDDRLPDLSTVVRERSQFDLIVLSAVWMHVPADQRRHALETLTGLLSDDGAIYVTLRIGSEDSARGIHIVSGHELIDLATGLGFDAEELDRQSDLLGRSDIEWIAMSISAHGSTTP